VNVIGKLYRDPDEVRKVSLALRDLYCEQFAFVPRPLGLLETTGLVLSEEIRPAPAAFPEAVRDAAIAAARMHTSATGAATGHANSEADEARRVRERADVLAAHDSVRSSDVLRVAARLASRLMESPPDAYRPSHGSFKPSQLLFAADGRLVLTDLDHFELADPARDIGYFLAYLHPTAVWYGRGDARQRFESAAATFVGNYERAARELGLSADVTRGILHRSRLYEAALLFKIAARRANRLNSPRAGELSSILAEVTSCLDA
jgi:aminoglycoside phosphotransferase (APT) family kinase protein